jgi:hypothetical protein
VGSAAPLGHERKGGNCFEGWPEVAELDNGERIDLETLISDDGRYAPNGRCYVSQEAYEQAEALVQAWIKLKRELQYGRIPEDVTIDDIKLARFFLGMTSNAKLPKERLNSGARAKAFNPWKADIDAQTDPASAGDPGLF